MRSKTRELGIFTLGLGLGFTVIVVFLNLFLRNGPPRLTFSPGFLITLGILSIFSIVGGLLLVKPKIEIVWINLWVLTIGLIFDAIPWDGITIMVIAKWAISSLVFIMIWKTGMAAIKELRQGTASPVDGER